MRNSRAFSTVHCRGGSVVAVLCAEHEFAGSITGHGDRILKIGGKILKKEKETLVHLHIGAY